jgi:hypothetical protein
LARSSIVLLGVIQRGHLKKRLLLRILAKVTVKSSEGDRGSKSEDGRAAEDVLRARKGLGVPVRALATPTTFSRDPSGAQEYPRINFERHECEQGPEEEAPAMVGIRFLVARTDL